jgi:hypothetical protein
LLTPTQATDFSFLPIEPIRPANTRQESYARRQHQFSLPPQGPRRSSVFRRQSSDNAILPPKITIEGRLPHPAIITCDEPLPLRLIVKKLNNTSEIIFLKSLQIALIGHTRVRAHPLLRDERSPWLVVGMPGLHLPLGNSQTPAGGDMEIDSALWNRTPLPKTVAPTFETCNISRRYELEITIGLAYGSMGNIQVSPYRLQKS